MRVAEEYECNLTLRTPELHPGVFENRIGLHRGSDDVSGFFLVGNYLVPPLITRVVSRTRLAIETTTQLVHHTDFYIVPRRLLVSRRTPDNPDTANADCRMLPVVRIQRRTIAKHL